MLHINICSIFFLEEKQMHQRLKDFINVKMQINGKVQSKDQSANSFAWFTDIKLHILEVEWLSVSNLWSLNFPTLDDFAEWPNEHSEIQCLCTTWIVKTWSKTFVPTVNLEDIIMPLRASPNPLRFIIDVNWSWRQRQTSSFDYRKHYLTVGP